MTQTTAISAMLPDTSPPIKAWVVNGDREEPPSFPDKGGTWVDTVGTAFVEVSIEVNVTREVYEKIAVDVSTEVKVMREVRMVELTCRKVSVRTLTVVETLTAVETTSLVCRLVWCTIDVSTVVVAAVTVRVASLGSAVALQCASELAAAV